MIEANGKVALVTGATGQDGAYLSALSFDASKPDGTPRKLMSGDRLRALGRTPRIGLERGIAETYQWFLQTANVGDSTSTAS